MDGRSTRLRLIVQLQDVKHVPKAARVELELCWQLLDEVLLNVARVALQANGPIWDALPHQRCNQLVLRRGHSTCLIEASRLLLCHSTPGGALETYQ